MRPIEQAFGAVFRLSAQAKHLGFHRRRGGARDNSWARRSSGLTTFTVSPPRWARCARPFPVLAYNSMYFGFRFLYLLAAGIYLAAMVCAVLSRRRA